MIPQPRIARTFANSEQNRRGEASRKCNQAIANACWAATWLAYAAAAMPTEAAELASASDAQAPAPYVETIPGTDVSFQMTPIPGGSFLMGSPSDEAGRGDDEGPQVQVRVAPFWMAQREVTWAEYHEFMKLVDAFESFDEQGLRQLADKHGVDAVTAPSKIYEPGFTYGTGDDPDQPAVTMSQYAAKQYTKWLSLLTGRFYRLPTEAEWEYACRAGSTTAYSFGEDPDDLPIAGWSYDLDAMETHAVGKKKPNAWGLYDMHGNVSEWVLDGYQEDWYAQLSPGVQSNEAIRWPDQLFPRVLRGGSWLLDPVDCRCASRRQSSDDDWRVNDPNAPASPWWFASDDSQDVGFRVVRPATPPPAAERAKYWDADLPEIQEVADSRIDEEGRGKRGRVDPELPAAIQRLNHGPEKGPK